MLFNLVFAIIIFAISFSLVVPACAADTRDDIIRVYFSRGYTYSLIVCFLQFVHGISVSLRQLKRILRRLNLRRRRAIDRNILRRATTLIMVSSKTSTTIKL